MARRAGKVFVWALAALAACGDSSHPGTGDDDQPPPSDAGVDGSAGVPLTVGDGGNVFEQWSFGDTPIGSHGSVTLFVTNTGTTATGALAISLTGSAADQFAIAASSTCSGAVLAAGDQCRVVLSFAPAGDPGTRDAQLSITGAAAALSFPLHGTATPALTGLTTDVAMLDFGLTELGHTSLQPVTLTNAGATAIALGTPTTTSIFGVASSTCPASLMPAASCTITVQLAPAQLGMALGTLTIPSDANTVTVQLTGTGARRLSVTIAGAGAGRVQSSPSGVDCTTGSCDALFPGDVVFTATPDTDNAFSGWTPICGTATMCAVPATSATVALTAAFVSTTGTHRLHIAFAGAGTGTVDIAVTDGLPPPPCAATCDVDVTAGTVLQLIPSTPSMFGGWSGGCTLDDTECVATMTSDRNVTVTFDRDDREIATLRPGRAVQGLAFAADGNLIIGDDQQVSEVKLDGTVVWSTPITGGVHGLVTDDAGRIYGGGGTMPGGIVFAMSATGGMLWTKPLAIEYPGITVTSIQSTVQVSPDGTVVAALTTSGLSVLDGNGNDRFAVPGVNIDGMAVAADGTVAIGTSSANFPDQLDLHRYTPSGTELALVSPLPGDARASLAFDAAGGLGSITTSFSHAQVAYTTPALTTAWSTRTETDDSVAPAGLVFDSGGNMVVTYTQDSTFIGLHIEQLATSSGASLWTLLKAPADSLFGDFEPQAIAADHAKRVAIGGAYDFAPWVAVYQMP
ncbi:MAG TPA: choice-of-anchor D domain-containing protein [Kofleriaceae bacterium]|nr:choice-of-anchor D domain-containing protein [Kofleriaceae bacterium]